MDLKEYSNAADVAAENIPQSVINDMAEIFLEIFLNMAAQAADEPQKAKTA